jgi:hypothetical protein
LDPKDESMPDKRLNCWEFTKCGREPGGTECGGKPQGTFAQKIESCQACELYLKIMDEEYPHYVSTKNIMPMIH